MFRTIHPPPQGLTPGEIDYIIWRADRDLDLPAVNAAQEACLSPEHCGEFVDHCVKLAYARGDDEEDITVKRQKICPGCEVDYMNCPTVSILEGLSTGNSNIFTEFSAAGDLLIRYLDSLNGERAAVAVPHDIVELLPYDGLPPSDVDFDTFQRQRNLLYNQFRAAEAGIDGLDFEDRAIANKMRIDLRARKLAEQEVHYG